MTYDKVLVQNMTFHAISTGLKDENIRHSFSPILSKVGVTDEELISELNSIVAKEIERKTQLDHRTNQLQLGLGDHKNTASVDESSLTNDIKQLRADVAFLKEQIKSKGSSDNTSASTNNERKSKTSKTVPQCKWCEEKEEKGVCQHCFRCGSTEHWQRGCKRRNQKQQGNETGLC